VTAAGHPILVVGAGPVGLAAAIAIADHGYAVTLIAPPAPPDERTSALMAGSVAFLARLGVWERLAGRAAPLKTLRIVDATDRLLRAPEVAFDAREIDLDAFGYNVPNVALVAALDETARARGIVRVAALADAVRIADGEVVVTAASAEHRAPLVVAADGRRSRLREAAGIAVSERRYDQAALVCNLRHSRPHHDTSTEFHTPAGPFTLVPLPGDRSSLVWVDRPAETERRLRLDEEALAAGIEERSASILGAIAIDGRRAAFPLAAVTATRLGARRVALAGEAAHVLPPIGAQGLNLGLRDAMALADILADRPRDPGAEAVLARYEQARRADLALRGAAIDALNRTLLSDFLPVQALRGAGLFLLDKVAPLRRFAMRQGVGL
jgi:2-octaprenyl-6-methoxyphenol hydroxylase